MIGLAGIFAGWVLLIFSGLEMALEYLFLNRLKEVYCSIARKGLLYV